MFYSRYTHPLCRNGTPLAVVRQGAHCPKDNFIRFQFFNLTSFKLRFDSVSLHFLGIIHPLCIARRRAPLAGPPRCDDSARRGMTAVLWGFSVLARTLTHPPPHSAAVCELLWNLERASIVHAPPLQYPIADCDAASQRPWSEAGEPAAPLLWRTLRIGLVSIMKTTRSGRV